MADKILMLALSPTMTEGTIASWKYAEGDAIKKGSVLCEVETDKAVMDYEAPVGGTLLKITRPAGSKAAVGDLIAVAGTVGEDIAAILAASPPASAPSPEPSVPQSISDARPAVAAVRNAAASFSSAVGSAPSYAPGVPRSSPLARVLARRAGIDIRAISGSGPGGRVVKRDIEVYAASDPAALKHAVQPSLHPAARLDDTFVPLSGMRAAVARRLSESMREAPHFFLRAAVDAERLLEARELINEKRAEKISLNSFFVKLAASAIARHPMVNASWEGELIRLRKSVDVALAVALPDGLVAPVVRDCAQKGIEAIEAEFRLLIEKAKTGTLQPSDYADASFTVSNLGAWGVEEFTAIINPPGSAILALGAISKEAVVGTDPSGDHIVVRRTLRATLSCDHRVIDGAVGAAFLKDLKDSFEEPARALL